MHSQGTARGRLPCQAGCEAHLIEVWRSTYTISTLRQNTNASPCKASQEGRASVLAQPTRPADAGPPSLRGAQAAAGSASLVQARIERRVPTGVGGRRCTPNSPPPLQQRGISPEARIANGEIKVKVAVCVNPDAVPKRIEAEPAGPAPPCRARSSFKPTELRSTSPVRPEISD